METKQGREKILKWDDSCWCGVYAASEGGIEKSTASYNRFRSIYA
jgi:hypothetical protein